MKAEEFLKQRDIPNEVITVQRDGFIEGNRISFLMEEYAQSQAERSGVSDDEIMEAAVSKFYENNYTWNFDYGVDMANWMRDKLAPVTVDKDSAEDYANKIESSVGRFAAIYFREGVRFATGLTELT